jgi:hypothetical protein
MSALKLMTGAAATWSAVVVFACEVSRYVAQGAPPSPIFAPSFQDRWNADVLAAQAASYHPAPPISPRPPPVEPGPTRGGHAELTADDLCGSPSAVTPCAPLDRPQTEVRREDFTSPQLAQATPEDLAQARDEERHRHRHAGPRDLCARAGMHKEFYHRGRWLYWHCKRLPT